MLQFKGEESVARGIRHFMHSTQSFIKRHIETTVAENPNSVFESIVEDAIKEPQAQFWRDIQEISDKIENGQYAMILLVPMSAQEKYDAFVRDLAKNLYQATIAKSQRPEDMEPVQVLVYHLMLRSATQFIDETRNKQTERLARLFETKTLSAWYNIFQVEEWQEKHLLDSTDQLIETLSVATFSKYQDVLIAGDDEGTEFSEKARHDLFTSVCDSLYDDLSSSLKYHAERCLVDNDDRQQLIVHVIPEVVDKKVRRLMNRVESQVDEIVADYVENNQILKNRSTDLF